MTKMPIKANRRASNPPRRKAGSKLLSPTLGCSPQSELAEELLHTICDSSPVGVYVLQDRKFQYANPKFVELTGYSKDELLGMDAMGLVLPEDRNMVRESAIEMLKGKRFYPYEFRAINKAGEPRWIIATVSSIHYRGSRAVLGNYMDISERKQAEEALQESEEKYRMLVEDALVGIMNVDITGKITYVNKTILEVTGYSWEEMVGKNAFSLGLISSEMVKTLRKRLKEKLMGQPSGLLEIQYKRKDGEWIWLQIRGQVLRKGNVPVGIQIIGDDITERKKAEQALEESRGKFQEMFESITDGISVVDFNGIIIETNQRAVEIHGFSSKDELVGRNAQELIAPRDRERIAANMRKTVKEGAVRGEEYTMLKADGTEFPGELSTSVFRDASGKPIGHITIVRDITKRKLAEEVLRESEEKYKTLAEDIPVGIYFNDFGGTFLYGNKKAEEIAGYRREELLGKSFLRLKLLEPEGLGKAIKLLALNRLGKATGPDEFVLNRKDGSKRIVEISTRIITVGGKKVVLGMVEDITTRKRAEKALEASRASFHNIVEMSADGVVVTDSNGVIRFVNQALESLLNHKADELLGEMFDFPVVAGETTEIDIVRRDGKPGVAEMRVVETKWDGETAYLASVRDITERKQVEEKLRELDHMRSELISNISHELRSPLHATQGFTKLMLQKKVPDPETQEEFLAIIDEQIERLGNLIDDLLDMSRFEAGRFSIQKRRTLVRDVIHDAVGSFDCLAKENSLAINEDIPASLPEVEVDEERLKQVMVNLLSNAIKFRQDSSPIMVKVENRDSELLVQVIDHGVGIPTEAMPHLFEKFYRARDTMARGGTGLGLYISKQIIEAHGGRIWAESKPGKGSTFYFTIPKLKQKRKKIGEILVADGLITRQQLEEKLRKQQDGEYRP